MSLARFPPGPLRLPPGGAALPTGPRPCAAARPGAALACVCAAGDVYTTFPSASKLIPSAVAVPFVMCSLL
ncbi:MAG: hypothetical protein LBS19_00650 [Clostridiales bacterium]|nr:hypothetical protein [Clostridiales bacterium]